MALYAKDSVVIIIQAAEDGYSSEYIYFAGQSPPPGLDDMRGAILRKVQQRQYEQPAVQHRIAADKTNLKNELGGFIDNFLD